MTSPYTAAQHPYRLSDDGRAQTWRCSCGTTTTAHRETGGTGQ